MRQESRKGARKGRFGFHVDEQKAIHAAIQALAQVALPGQGRKLFQNSPKLACVYRGLAVFLGVSRSLVLKAIW